MPRIQCCWVRRACPLLGLHLSAFRPLVSLAPVFAAFHLYHHLLSAKHCCASPMVRLHHVDACDSTHTHVSLCHLEHELSGSGLQLSRKLMSVGKCMSGAGPHLAIDRHAG